MNCRTGLLLVTFCMFIQNHYSQEIAIKSQQENTIATSASQAFKKVSRTPTLRRLFDSKKIRTKRSTIFPAGVKVCPQESIKQIVASHLVYYKLRVCQEAVWEAFRIFMDRIPQTLEYEYWVNACRQESFCIFDIGKNFSNSQEHLELIQQRVKWKDLNEKKDELSSEDSLTPAVTEESHAIPTDIPHSESVSLVASKDTLFNEIMNDTKPLLKETEVTNLVPEQPKQQIVEFTVTLTNQEFTAELSDANSPQYQELASNFRLQMQKVFEKLPGFKEIQVLRFRQKKEKDGSDSIVVRYAVVFERGSPDSKNKIDETPTIASNKVEASNNEEPEEMSYSVMELQHMVAMALQDDRSLPVDLQTLLFSDDPDIPSEQPATDHISDTESTSKTKTDLEDVLFSELPLDKPAAEDVLQNTSDDFTGNTDMPYDMGLSDILNWVTTESLAHPDQNSYFTSNNGLLSSSVLYEIDHQTQSLVDSIENMDNKVLDTFSVPFDTTDANDKVFRQDEQKHILDSNEVLAASDDPSKDVLPPSVDTINLIIPFSTLTPHTEGPQFNDEQESKLSFNDILQTSTKNSFEDNEFKGMSENQPGDVEITINDLSSIIPSMTLETPHGFTMESLTLINAFTVDEVLVTESPEVKALPTEGTEDFDESKENFSSTETIWTVQTLPADVDESIMSTTQELQSNIQTLAPSVMSGSSDEAISTTKIPEKASAEVTNSPKATTPEATEVTEESKNGLLAETVQMPLENTDMFIVNTPETIGVTQEMTQEMVKKFELPTSEDTDTLEVTTAEATGIVPTQEMLYDEVFKPTTLEVTDIFEVTTRETIGVAMVPTQEMLELFERTTLKVQDIFVMTTPGSAEVTMVPTQEMLEEFDHATPESEVAVTEETTPEFVEPTDPKVTQVITDSTLQTVISAKDTTALSVEILEDTTTKSNDMLNNLTPEVIAVLEEATPEADNVYNEITPTSLIHLSSLTGQSNIMESTQQYDNAVLSATTQQAFGLTQMPVQTAEAFTESEIREYIINSTDVLSTEVSGNSASTLENIFNYTEASSRLEFSTPTMATSAEKGKDLVVFFSLRVTNMPFSQDLFNKSSPEYRALEQQFLHLLLPYLQSNLTGFKNLEILNFKKGSVIVNSKLQFAKPLPYNVTKAVHCILEDFCNAAAQLLNLQIDSYSLDIEQADQADPCKFTACDDFAQCAVDSVSNEATCVCKPGYVQIDGQQCRSVCDLDPSHCSEEEICEVVPEKGAVCRLPVPIEKKHQTSRQ